MTETAFILQSCTRAIAGAEEAVHLLEQKSRLEQAVSSNDPVLTLDTAKTLLESVFKTILSDRVNSPKLNKDMSPLFTDVRNVLTFNNDDNANEILKRLTNSIVHNVAELRNKYGAASHGDDGYFENPIEMPEAEMVAHIVDGMSGFLFRKHKHLNDPESLQRIFYSDYEGFNEWLDTQNDAIKIPVLDANDIPFSIFLYSNDVDTYRAMLLQYLETEKEDSGGMVEISYSESAVERLVLPEVESQPAHEIEDHEIEDKDEVVAISEILNQHSGKNVEPAKIQLIAEHLSNELVQYKVVDWFVRDSAIAKIRSMMRIVLRKYGFPSAERNKVINTVITLLVEKEVKENM